MNPTPAPKPEDPHMDNTPNTPEGSSPCRSGGCPETFPTSAERDAHEDRVPHPDPEGFDPDQLIGPDDLIPGITSPGQLPPKWQGEDYLRRHPEHRGRTASPLVEQPGYLFGADHATEGQHGNGCEWPRTQCTGHAAPSAATGSNVAQGDLTPSEGLCSWPENCPHPDRCARGCVVPASTDPAGSATLGAVLSQLVTVDPTQRDDPWDSPDDLNAMLDEHPATPTEANRRLHLAPFMFDLLDPTTTVQAKTNALRHLIVCDPGRAILGLAFLSAGLIGDLEQDLHMPPGGMLAMLKADLALVAEHNQREG